MKNEELYTINNVRARARVLCLSVTGKALLIAPCLLLLLFLSCQHDEADAPVTYSNAAVEFSTDDGSLAWADPSSSTRATTGPIADLSTLKQLFEGIGVYGYFTDNKTWSQAKTAASYPTLTQPWTASTDPKPDFMMNEQLLWDTTKERWTYEPPKYWPNSTDNATPRRISFFAYAPCIENAPETGITGNTYGITQLPGSEDRSPRIRYAVGALDTQQDLLWACCPDATRMGNGLIVVKDQTKTYEKVPLAFHHALSRIDIYVQRVYDEQAFSGKVPTDPDYTRLFISKLELTATSGTLHREGILDLETGDWTGTTAYDDNKLSFAEDVITELIRGTTSSTAAVIRDTELDKWKRNTDNGVFGTFGIDEVERPLLANSRTLMILPSGALKLSPKVTYSMVTRDNELQLNYLTDAEDNRYQRIVNTVTGNTIDINLQSGKHYKLVVQIGVETVRFVVAGIEDWDFPLRFVTPVEDYEQETENKTVNED